MGRRAKLTARARAVSLLSLDVDGVLTDGTLYYGPDGEVLKAFHVRDGLGIRLLLDEGIAVAVISARRSVALERRLAELGVTHALLGEPDKGAALDALLARTGCAAEAVAHVGDDLVDLPVFARVGLAIAVADAHPSVREAAAWITKAGGGRGAVREIADAMLEARGRLDAIVARYREGTFR